MHKILLVEDSKEIFTIVEQALGAIAKVDWVASAQEASHAFHAKYDLILLDVELPDGNGIELCTQIQRISPRTPVFILTSHNNLSEKVLGFSAGADDYITKPFAPLELKARVEARLRKVELTYKASNLLKWKELEINKNRQEVSVFTDSSTEKIDLTALEFKLLTYFAERPEDVIHRDQILNDIWGENIHIYSRSVDTHVSKLRKKLGPASHIIESVHGSGYKFCPTT